MDENGFDHDLHKKLTEAGLMAIHMPEEYGGGGGDAITSEIVITKSPGAALPWRCSSTLIGWRPT